MFCSNCGKTIRQEDNACQHCGATLGEGRFYGNTYTSCQVRIPAGALGNAPEGGMISYTRTNYMTSGVDAAHRQFAHDALKAAGEDPEDWIDEPQDIHTGTVYRPLLRPEEDLTRIEAEEAARRAQEQAEAEAAAQAEAEEAARRNDDFDEAEEDAEYEDEQSAPEEYAQEQPAQDADAEPENDVNDDADEVSTSPLPPLKKAAISPRVLSYMEEMERQQQRRAGGGSFRMPPFLANLNRRKKDAPVAEELPEAEDIPAAAEEAYEEPAFESENTETYEDEDFEGEGFEETEADEEASEEECSEAEFGREQFREADVQDDADQAESYDGDGYAEAAYDEADATDGAPVEEVESDEADADDYVAQDDAYDSFDEEDGEEDAPEGKFDLGALLSGFDFKALLQNRILAISVAAALIIAVLTAGIFWLNFVTTKRARIVDVTYSVYSQGIELLQNHVGEEYRDSMTQVYLTNTATANQHFSEDMAALNALLPEEAADNDPLFITTLTILQDSIVDAIKADADAELNDTAAARAETSQRDWQAIEDAVARLAEASTPGELSVIAQNLESIVVPTIAPTIAPTAVPYKILSNGMMDDVEVRQMQNRLLNLGYLDGEADGDFGNGTEAAVKAFQRAVGLPADGVATAAMQEALFAEDAPRAPGSQNTGAAPSNPSAE